MLAGRRRLGKTQKAAAAEAGVTLGLWQALEKLDFASYRIERIEEGALAIAAYLSVPVQQIAPDALFGLAITSTLVQTRTVSAGLLLSEARKGKAISYLPNPAASLEQQEREKRLSAVLATLRPRDRLILELKYGLIDGYEYTDAEISTILKVSTSAVNFAEKQALCRLRRPWRAKLLENI